MIDKNNGWINIKDEHPKNEEEVYVILERQSKYGSSYDITICFSYFINAIDPYFTKENPSWKVRYWRRIKPELPQEIIDRYVEDCVKNNIVPNLPIRY